MDEFGVDGETTGLFALIFGALALYLIVAIGVYILVSFGLGKCFEKAGKPLWAAFIPVYNMVVVLEIIGRPLWWLALILLSIVPIIGPLVVLILSAIVWIDFAKSFGKTMAWGILITFFSPIMLPIMGFSSDIAYIGPAAKQAGTSNLI